MKELSLNILDIVENSVKAKATLTQIIINEQESSLEIIIKDDGIGMTEEVLRGVTDPFYTTRTTRKVGLGLPLLKLQAEQTGGHISVSSKHIDSYPTEHGTQVSAFFDKSHIDFTPLGDVVSSITTLIQGHPDTDFLFTHSINGKSVTLDTREIREVLEDIPLNSYDVIKWIEGFLQEQYASILRKEDI